MKKLEARKQEIDLLKNRLLHLRLAMMGRCGVSPLEGVAKDREAGCSEGETSPKIIMN